MAENRKPLLQTQKLTKYYDAVKALRGVSLSLESGEILGLIGENGAGKSTFAKCLTGLTRPTSGTILMDGAPIHPPVTAIAGIPQEFDLVADLTVAENIFLGREPAHFGFLDRKTMRKESSRLLEKLGVEIDPDCGLGTLSPGRRQMIAIAKALSCNCRILLMDEPTTILNPAETGRLFTVMREFQARGNSIIYISHKLPEVKEICNRIAVFRDGELVAEGASDEFTPRQMAEKMVGRELTRLFPPRPTTEPGEVILETRALCAPPLVRGVNLTLRRGELLGVAGLDGAGRTETAEAIAGLRRITSGELLLHGQPIRFRTPAQAIAAGISYLPEDRQRTGILPDFSIEANVTLTSLAHYCRGGFFSKNATRAAARRYIEKFHIKPSDPDAPLRALSGGNQQKVAVGRGLDSAPEIFIFDEPTRGVDVAARCEIYEFLRELADSGVACLLISSDMEELLGMCREVVVFRAGQVAGRLSGDQLNEKNLMYLAIGVDQP